MKEFDVIIMGGGAAGLMCAIVAGSRGRSVLVLEGSNKIGKKILMSGGGRCNFTNLNTQPGHFISANPHFCKSALSRFTPYDFVALVDQHQISYHEKTAGQLFCDNSSKDILQMLATECDKAGAEIRVNAGIRKVTHSERFDVETEDARFATPVLVIATGGLSIPKMGASDFGYRLARQFGLKVLATRAGLVPFTFTGAQHDLCERLSGVSLPASLSTNGMTFQDDILFTHRGLSGPAALQLSSYWSPGDAIAVNLLPTCDAEKVLLAAKNVQPKSLLRTVLSELMPRALVLELQDTLWPNSAELPVGQISGDALHRLAGMLQHWTLKPSGTEGYRTAEVTLGGVDTNELSSQTMECRQQPGLYCIGEVVDVTGHLGGFNFQWAWASAHAAGNAV